MLKVSVKLRPTASQILKYPIVKEMIEVYLSDIEEVKSYKIDDLKINKKIYLPQNINRLNHRLPRSNYETTVHVTDKEILPKPLYKPGIPLLYPYSLPHASITHPPQPQNEERCQPNEEQFY